MAQGDLQKSVADYTKAVEICPDYAEAYFRRAIVRRDLGNLEEAADDYDKAIVLNPRLAGAPVKSPSTPSSARSHW